LVTAVANQRPGLFAGVIGQVPVTDMLRYQHFTGGHMWADEYGSSDQMGAKYLLEYSPYHTVKKAKYPAMLIMSGDHDDRVVPLHTYKYVAELQYKTS
jgi:prolyl oligopeptidase